MGEVGVAVAGCTHLLRCRVSQLLVVIRSLWLTRARMPSARRHFSSAGASVMSSRARGSCVPVVVVILMTMMMMMSEEERRI